MQAGTVLYSAVLTDGALLSSLVLSAVVADCSGVCENGVVCDQIWVLMQDWQCDNKI